MRQVRITTWEHRPDVWSWQFIEVDDDSGQAHVLLRGQSDKFPVASIVHYLDRGETAPLLRAVKPGDPTPGDSLLDEIARLHRWIGDLHSGMFINCVYCGHRYGPAETTPMALADILKAHVVRCEAHPMSKVQADHDAMLAELQMLEATNRSFADKLRTVLDSTKNKNVFMRSLLNYLDGKGYPHEDTGDVG